MEGQYKVLTQDDLRTRQNEDIHKVAELLSVAPGLAAVLLRHSQWIPERVHGGWFDNVYAFRVAVGLPLLEKNVSGPKVLTRGQPDCPCFDVDDLSAGGPARSAGCSHYYCDACWRRHIHEAMDEQGPQCLPMRCLHRNCDMPVVRELVVDVVNDGDTTVALYDQLMLSSYVDDSGGRIQWCHGRGCSRAVEFLGGDVVDVWCECGHGFCWTCGKEPHRPMSCDAASAWVEEKTQQAWQDDQLLEKALRDMADLKSSGLVNMAADLGVQVRDLDFLARAYEEIAECRRRVRWLHAYGYYYLQDQDRDGGMNRNKRELFDLLLEEAHDWLKSLQGFAEEERLMLALCATHTDVEAISEMYSASRTKVGDLTRQTRQHFEMLVKAAETHFQYY